MHIPMKPKLKAKSFQWLLENMGGLRVIWYKMGREPDEDDEQKAIALEFRNGLPSKSVHKFGLFCWQRKRK